MDIFILVVFILGYAFIALEHNVHIDKAASALVTGTVCWALFVLGGMRCPLTSQRNSICSRPIMAVKGTAVWPNSSNTGCSTTWRRSAASCSS